MISDPDRLDLTFAPLEPSDFERLRVWHNAPHVAEWWGATATPDGIGGAGEHAATIEQVTAEYLPEMQQGGPGRFHLIVVAGEPVGMIQWYPLGAYPDYTAELGEALAGTAGIDLFIGEVSKVGRGIGSAAIRTYAETIVFADPTIDRCIGAPDVRNARSIRAFEKAGFRFVRDAQVTGEPAPEHVMVLDRDRH